jgi:hypothetical protein
MKHELMAVPDGSRVVMLEDSARDPDAGSLLASSVDHAIDPDRAAQPVTCCAELKLPLGSKFESAFAVPQIPIRRSDANFIGRRFMFGWSDLDRSASTAVRPQAISESYPWRPTLWISRSAKFRSITSPEGRLVEPK